MTSLIVKGFSTYSVKRTGAFLKSTFLSLVEIILSLTFKWTNPYVYKKLGIKNRAMFVNSNPTHVTCITFKDSKSIKNCFWSLIVLSILNSYPSVKVSVLVVAVQIGIPFI